MPMEDTLKEAFRVDWSPGGCPSIQDQLDEIIRKMEEDTPKQNRRSEENGNKEEAVGVETASSMDPRASTLSVVDEMEVDIQLEDLWGESKPLVPGVSMTAGQVKRLYGDERRLRDHNIDGSSRTKEITTGDKVVCVLKLCLAELVSGESPIIVEEHLRRLSIALELGDNPQLSIGTTSIQCQFGTGPLLLVNCYFDIAVSRLKDVSKLSILMQRGYTTNYSAASLLLDKIMARKDPYGWAIVDLNTIALCSFTSAAQFFGSWLDMAATAACVAVWILVRRTIFRQMKRFVGSIEVLLVSFTIGLVTSFFWRYFYRPRGYAMCHIFIIFLSSILTYLPGGDIVYGTYEVYAGNFVHGSSRLISALVRLMYISFGLLFGWQIFGHGQLEANDVLPVEREDQLSLILGSTCEPFSDSYEHISPWWFVAYIMSLLVVPFSLVEFKVRFRDWIGPGVTSYITLILLETLLRGCDGDRCGNLPNYLYATITVFVVQNIACSFEYFGGVPSTSSMQPAFLLLAPGAGSLIRVLNQMGRDADLLASAAPSDLFASVGLQGVSLSLGVVLAQSYWSAILTERNLRDTSFTSKKKQIYFDFRTQRY